MTATLFTVLMCTLPVQSAVYELNTTFDEPVSSGVGGRTMLVEEITATWCPTCASIDPELIQVADGHGSRIALLALHPTDGSDAFQPEASKHRIERLRLSLPDAGNATPTFIVEGGEERKGYDAWSQVQSDILDTELMRQQTSTLEFEVIETPTGYRATVKQAQLIQAEDSQLTFLVAQHLKPVPEDAINPGGPHRDRVLVGLAECLLDNNTIQTSIGLEANVSANCVEDFQIDFPAMASWSVVLVHEPIEEVIESGQRVQTFGAVELAIRERSSVSETTGVLGSVLLAGCVVLAAASIVRKK